MASVGRESPRSPTAAAASIPECSEAGPPADTDSIAGGGKPTGVGPAGIEVDVGNMNILFEVQSDQKKRCNKTKAAKKLSKGGGARGRGKTKSLGGRSASPSPSENAAGTTTAEAEAAVAPGGGGGRGGGGGEEKGGGGGGGGAEGWKKGPGEEGKVHAALSDAAAAEGVEGRGDIVDTVAATAAGSSSKGFTRERSQQMYETYRQTQV